MTCSDFGRNLGHEDIEHGQSQSQRAAPIGCQDLATAHRKLDAQAGSLLPWGPDLVFEDVATAWTPSKD